MNKLALAIAATVFALMTIFTSSAEAGMKGKIGLGILGAAVVLGAAHSYNKKQAKTRRAKRARRYRAKKKAVAKKKSTPKKTSVAKVQDEVQDEVAPVNKIAQTEQSSISGNETEVGEIADVEPEEKVAETVADTTTEDEPVVANELGCKKFFPTVALTLTVPCE